MNHSSTIFSQIMEYLPIYEFNKCVKRYQGDQRFRTFSTLNQFYVMSFAQLTYRESLRDIEACLNAMRSKLYHMGIRGPVRRSTLADANEQRDWRIYADLAQVLIKIARPLYANDDIGIDLDNTIYALDSTTIDLCLTLFPWARFRANKAAVKMHTLIDLHGSIPVFIHITDGKVHDVNILDILLPEPGAIYLIDRGYIDFLRLAEINTGKAIFVTLAKSNLQYRRLYSNPADIHTGVHFDQIIKLTGIATSKDYPDKLRLIHFYDKEHLRHLHFLTNDLVHPALIIAQLYKGRWSVEFFFKWIKQHLRIKVFYGLSENAVKTQIWIAVCIYVLVAIIKKKLNLEMSLYTILQVISMTVFEKMPILEAFYDVKEHEFTASDCIQLNLFDL
ncbi:MAG: IS4 family transposase [Chitinispirillaceae bacterium]|nr:IS4 family transposase [Chitinispirillaceae bacterium]